MLFIKIMMDLHITIFESSHIFYFLIMKMAHGWRVSNGINYNAILVKISEIANAETMNATSAALEASALLMKHL